MDINVGGLAAGCRQLDLPSALSHVSGCGAGGVWPQGLRPELPQGRCCRRPLWQRDKRGSGRQTTVHPQTEDVELVTYTVPGSGVPLGTQRRRSWGPRPGGRWSVGSGGFRRALGAEVAPVPAGWGHPGKPGGRGAEGACGVGRRCVRGPRGGRKAPQLRARLVPAAPGAVGTIMGLEAGGGGAPLLWGAQGLTQGVAPSRARACGQQSGGRMQWPEGVRASARSPSPRLSSRP